MFEPTHIFTVTFGILKCLSLMMTDLVWKMKLQTWTSRVEDRGTSEVQVTSRPLSDEWQSTCLDAGWWTVMPEKSFSLVVGPCRWDSVGGPAETAEGAGDEDFLSAGKTAEKEAPTASSAETQGLSHCLRVGIYKLWWEQEQCWNSVVTLYHVTFTASV